MQGANRSIRRLTEGVTRLHAPLFSLEPDMGKLEKVESAAALVEIAVLAFLTGLALGLLVVVPPVAGGLLVCVAVGVLGRVYYTVLRRRTGKNGNEAELDEDQPRSVSFFDIR